MKTANKIMMPNGELIALSGATFEMFDTILKDHILTYEQSKGWALQGTYVYKEAVVGSRYGYPDFYNKCVEESELGTPTETTLGNSTITMYINANGHTFYDIADKEAIDAWYSTYGIAWYYGVDTENERIFLPCTKWFIQPSGEITEVNSVNEAGLPNITGTVNGFSSNMSSSTQRFGAFTQIRGNRDSSIAGSDMWTCRSEFNASNSNSIYGNSDTVQPPSINQLLYICVGNTNVESAVTDVVDVTTTENDTVPLGYSTYQNGTQPNVSWLKSQGQWNDGNVYTTFYNEFVQKIGQPFASGYVKEITEEYDDYDLVINQDDMTFRLPLLDGSESVIDYTTNVSIPTDVGSTFIAPKRGYVYALYANNSSTVNRTLVITINGVKVVQTSGYNTSSSQRSSGQLIEINKGDTLLVVEHNTSESKITFFPCKSNGSLYFKVANAVQNLELLDAGEVLESLADKISRQDCKAYVTETYVNGTSWYRVYSDGWCEQGGITSLVAPNTRQTVNLLKQYINTNYSIILTTYYDNAFQYSDKFASVTQPPTTSNFIFSTRYFSDGNNVQVVWQTCGYIR